MPGFAVNKYIPHSTPIALHENFAADFPQVTRWKILQFRIPQITNNRYRQYNINKLLDAGRQCFGDGTDRTQYSILY